MMRLTLFYFGITGLCELLGKFLTFVEIISGRPLPEPFRLNPMGIGRLEP